MLELSLFTSLNFFFNLWRCGWALLGPTKRATSLFSFILLYYIKRTITDKGQFNSQLKIFFFSGNESTSTIIKFV